MIELPRYSMGIGDRFAHQGRAQLAAFVEARRRGIAVTPVWNKSNREHNIVHTEPGSVRVEADAAVRALDWSEPYFVDADHIGLETVERFLASSDFFTIDVADAIGQPADERDAADFADSVDRFTGTLRIPGIAEAFTTTRENILAIAAKYLRATRQAGDVYRAIESRKGRGQFIAEVSMDETDQPQTPAELLFILAALAREGVPLQTIAPKFTGRFNKGVDYVGDIAQFEKEFRDDLAVIAFAIQEFGLPANLKLSVHSGSDKFSIYPAIHRALQDTGAGLHLKTAGTTWLEELIGLALAEGDGLNLAREVYRRARSRYDELCAPYATVIDIDIARLPEPADVDHWSGEQFAQHLRHDPSCPQYNPHFRQLLHVGFKVAAQMGQRYTQSLDRFETVIAENVTTNLFERHLRPVFIGA